MVHTDHMVQAWRRHSHPHQYSSAPWQEGGLLRFCQCREHRLAQKHAQACQVTGHCQACEQAHPDQSVRKKYRDDICGPIRDRLAWRCQSSAGKHLSLAHGHANICDRSDQSQLALSSWRHIQLRRIPKKGKTIAAVPGEICQTPKVSGRLDDPYTSYRGCFLSDLTELAGATSAQPSCLSV